MPGSVARLSQPPNDGGGISPADLYKIAVDEYRFQAQYNWSRTQYLLGFNAAVLAAALALVERSGRSSALVFLVGLCAAVLSAAVVRQQHDYYRAARDHMRRIEDQYELAADLRLDTTSTLGGRRRKASVNQVVYLLLALIGVADVSGAVLALSR
jgi:hypothetical protein